MTQILIIEDNRGLNNGLYKALKNENRTLTSCWDLQSAREQLCCQTPDLILLDLNLPDGNGLSLLKELRKRGQTPAVILLTANDTDEDMVKGLEMGADDYITKPFSLSVLRARVNTQLRKLSTIAESMTKIGPYVFNFSTQEFSVDGNPVYLSKTEQKLLRLLVENRGRTMERGTLVDWIWTDGSDYVDENALSVTIKRLRDKLHGQDVIKTVYGIGYMWEKQE